MTIPVVIFESIGAAKSVSELLDLLLRILNLQSSDVERLEKKWDIKQHADFQSAVQLLRLSRMESDDVQLIDLDLLKKGLAELLKSWNYYTDLNRKGILDQTVELELVYILSGWLIARCYLKIQQYETRQELIEDAVIYYMRVMEFTQEKIALIRNPIPPQPIKFFHMVDTAIIDFVSKGNLFIRVLKSFFIIIILLCWFISIPYLVLDILVRVFGYAICGQTKVSSAFLKRLNEMYLKSLVEVAPYINERVLTDIGFLPQTH